MSSARGLAVHAEGNLDRRLTTAARTLVVLLPVCYLAGRVPTDIALSLVALLFIGRSALTRDWAWTHSGWLRIGMALWLWMMVDSAFALDTSLSYQQSMFWWRFLIFAAALEWWVMDEPCMRRVLMVATVVLMAVAVDAWVQYITGTDLLGHPRYSEFRLTGPFDDPRVGSWLMRLMFPVVLGGFAWRIWKRNAHIAGGLLAAMVMVMGGAIVISGERMTMGLTVLGLALAALLHKGQVRGIILYGLGLMLAGGLILAVTNKEIVDRYINQTSETVETLPASPYGQIWRNALHMISQRPVTGVGMKNFRVACDDPRLGLPASNEYRCATHPHNLYLEWAVGSGVIGLALFIMLVAAWARRLAPAAWHGTAGPWLYGPAISVFLILWPLGPTGSFFSNWYGGPFYLSLGWALAAVHLSERRRAGQTDPV